ncbi:multidrug effflux MFS transporter [Sulfitobacter sp. D35]|uniref:multidrug effflux MFS transporter n=1 Tax=Sulfitobacter sp. D35 TaxID=3083252 RepID=UPI00296F331C|nr:multidrug effflux MFS transporter [Sulfitobacter sp. D35]MDW4497802.1 multidrug effflux MFS transporter [Sulfitobacter sp. D35]
MARIEFVALMAMMFATIAFSIDAMLPALPEIADELTPDDPQRAALIITSFVLGMGIGTFFTGPLSDAYGRRTVMFSGAALYIVSAAVAWASQSLELILAARLVQGLGASGPRIVSVAIMRDLFAGREMARILSIVMIIFTLFPAFAPALGLAIITLSGWRAIFAAFIVFSMISALWLAVRLPETLAEEDRRPLRLPLMFDAVGQMFAHPTVRISIMVQTLAMSMLFSLLMFVQPIYETVFGKADTFPYWFGGIAMASGLSSMLNAFLVVRFGMRRLVTFALGLQIACSLMMILSFGYSGPYAFAMFALWQFLLFFQAGLTVGNLNAIAMEPMGHIAGMAASVIGAVSTVGAAMLASPIGLLFDGTIRPLIVSVFIMAIAGFTLMLWMGKVERRAPAE